VIEGVAINCDTTGCRARCLMSAPDVASARQKAADRYGWSTTEDGFDRCGPCTRATTEETNPHA